MIANKLWWEFWPAQTVPEELDASLQRTGLDHFDFIYSDPPPPELAIEEVVEQVEGTGHGRQGARMGRRELARRADRGSPRAAAIRPVAAQLPYSLVQRSPVEDADMVQALGPMGVVASFVLAGGALTGKYPGRGRLARRARQPALRRGARGGGAAARARRRARHQRGGDRVRAQCPARHLRPARRDVAGPAP